MNTKEPFLDSTTKRVAEMYTQYPYPLVGTHREMFRDLVYPFVKEQGSINSILEAGCGTGNVAIAIAQLFPDVRVVGIDVTEESLSIAKESAAKSDLKNIEFRYSNLLEHDAGLGTFDFVHCQGVIHHLSDPLMGLENLYKYLNPGCHAYIWVYMLLGRRWILEIRELLSLLQPADRPYQERLEFTKEILSIYNAKKKPEGLKRHHENKPVSVVNDGYRPLNSRLLSALEYSIHLLNTAGWRVLGQKIGQKLFMKSEPARIAPSPQPVKINAEIESKRYNAGLTDMYLHPHDVFYRMSEILNLFAESGFSDVRISDGMSPSVEQFLGDDFPNIKQLVTSLPIEQQYQFIELIEKPSGVGFFVRKPLV